MNESLRSLRPLGQDGAGPGAPPRAEPGGERLDHYYDTVRQRDEVAPRCELLPRWSDTVVRASALARLAGRLFFEVLGQPIDTVSFSCLAGAVPALCVPRRAADRSYGNPDPPVGPSSLQRSHHVRCADHIN
jgi:hypothetical protein